jgi:hypothetical protein
MLSGLNIAKKELLKFNPQNLTCTWFHRRNSKQTLLEFFEKPSNIDSLLASGWQLAAGSWQLAFNLFADPE